MGRKYSNNIEALLDLNAKRIDAVVIDEIVGRYYIAKKQDEHRILEENLGDESYAVGIRKEDVSLFILRGAITTFNLYIVTAMLCVPLGILLAVFKISRYSFLSKVIGIYTWIFRGTLLLLQLFFSIKKYIF